MLKYFSNIKYMRAAVATAAVVGSFILPASALAATANTPVGQITATQASGPCNDLGAVVNVSVTGGFANTAYTANAVRVANGPAHFTTNSSGAGGSSLVNVTPDGGGSSGNATVSVTANNQTGHVTVPISCSSGGGKG